jgi:rare lipoprotein A
MKKILLYLLFLVSTIATAQKSSELIDKNLKTDTLQLYKKNAHASYYHDKFNGRKTASGVRFDNDKLTAAHKKFPFGTKLKITNEKNNKSVIVEVTDRGPFIKGREIDLSKKAFMDITSNKHSGLEYVTIEILENKKTLKID